MSRPLRLAALLGVLAAAVALLLTGPAPAEAVRDLRGVAEAADPVAPLVSAVSLLAWLLTAWLALTIALTLLARVPGRTGGAAAAAVRRVAPAGLRRIVSGVLGVSVVAGTLTGTTAAAAAGTPAPPPAAASASLDWPGTAPAPAPGSAATPASLDWPGSAPAADLDWPAAAAAAEPPPPVLASPVRTGRAADTVVVEPGDTLWGLAEQSLQGQQGAPPEAAQVAAAWPSWWSANRELVGEDPDLLLPGTSLQPPPAEAADDPPG